MALSLQVRWPEPVSRSGFQLHHGRGRGRERVDGDTSDLLVNGINYDVYTPTTPSISRIISAMAKKNTQTTGIVLDLSLISVTTDSLGNALARVQGSIEAGGPVPNITDIVIMPK